jgi:hypothetical protein
VVGGVFLGGYGNLAMGPVNDGAVVELPESF